MFYHGRMALAQRLSGDRAPDVAALRARMQAMQAPRADVPTLPTDAIIGDLLPDGGLRAGAMYALDSSPALLLALLAPPSRAGSWCAAVGMPRLGAEAARLAGVALERLALVPSPGQRWAGVVSTLAEVMPLVAVRPPAAARPSDAEISRLSARLRERGATLLVQGPWPQAEAMLSLADPVWTGIGEGEGYLASREVTITVSSRRAPRPRSVRAFLPAPGGGIASAGVAEARGGRLRAVS